MASRDALDRLVDLVMAPGPPKGWAGASRNALTELFGGSDGRYPSSALTKEKDTGDAGAQDDGPASAVMVRAPDMTEGKDGQAKPVRFAALIDPRNPTSGAYGGASFVVFPVWDGPEALPCVFGLVVGTQGLAPDEDILGRPGHARKANAIARWLGARLPGGFAWAKADPTRTDQKPPALVGTALASYASVLQRYGNVMYLLVRPGPNRDGIRLALAAILDVFLAERGARPLSGASGEAADVERQWMEHLLPGFEADDLVELLRQRRYVVLEGPPGTGKTRMAGQVFRDIYGERGGFIQFHANTTYQSFVGGLAPVSSKGDIGLAFAPQPGHLMHAIGKAQADPGRDYCLVVDEINRADLSKVLGEAIYLLEADDPKPRSIDLDNDYPGIGRKLTMPRNLHILGTMNSADRSIAVVDIAVRRRFAFARLWPRLSVVQGEGCQLCQEAFRRVLTAFVEFAPSEAFDLLPGHSYYLGDERAAAQRLNVTLAPLLREYLAQGHIASFAGEAEAILQWLEQEGSRPQ